MIQPSTQSSTHSKIKQNNTHEYTIFRKQYKTIHNNAKQYILTQKETTHANIIKKNKVIQHNTNSTT